MHLMVNGAWRPMQGLFRAVLVLLALIALLLTTSFAAARPARAATTAAQMKAVLIVGPSGDTSLNKTRSDVVAAKAASWGMDVVKLYSPNATWAAVLENIQGANLVTYMGHGNGWPSPYGPYQENTKDGMGLNKTQGSTTVQYYGAKWFRTYVTLAPNAIVMLNHLCYASGNGEPGMAIPTYDVARQRVDNYANGFLFAGARAVFAYGTGNFEGVVEQLFSTSKTVDEIFMTPGSGSQAGNAYYGFVGWNDQRFDSVRMPGFKNHLDPESNNGYRRSLSGHMNMTGADWRNGNGGGGPPKPTVSLPRLSFLADRPGLDPVMVRLNWDASESPDVVLYELESSRDGGTWTNIALGSPTALTVDVGLAAVHDYRFRMRATDGAGTVGDWSTSGTRRLGRIQEGSPMVAYSGTWSNKLFVTGASGNYVKKAMAAGQNASHTFTANDVAFLTTVGPNRGMAELWLDGERVATLDLYSPTTKAAHMVWAAGVSGTTSHTLELRALGTKNAMSTAARVDMDALLTWR
jgi:hypothetical protein